MARARYSKSSGEWVRDDLVCLETLILSLLLREATAVGSLVGEGT